MLRCTILLDFVDMSLAHLYLFNFPWKIAFCSDIAEKGTITVILRMTFTLVDSTTLTVMTELSESTTPLVEFLVKLENWKWMTFIEINFFKALIGLNWASIGIKEERCIK